MVEGEGKAEKKRCGIWLQQGGSETESSGWTLGARDKDKGNRWEWVMVWRVD